MALSVIAGENRFERENPLLGLSDRSIQGTVTDANTTLPIEGATIMVKGTSIGTTTNSQGKFSLTVPDNSKILVISSVGYTSVETPINSNSVRNIADFLQLLSIWTLNILDLIKF